MTLSAGNRNLVSRSTNDVQVNRRSFLGALLATGAAFVAPIPAPAARVINSIPVSLIINGRVVDGFDVEIEVEDFADLSDDDRAGRRFPAIMIRTQVKEVDIEIKLDLDE